ncbi:MAG: YSC84-related protein [Candidatus Hydrogenedentota bacterium]
MCFARFIAAVSVLSVAAASFAQEAQDDTQGGKDKKREEINIMAEGTLERLLQNNETAKKLFDDSVGYAVFDTIKVSLLIAGGGGQGVAIEKASGNRTYMRMGTAGLSVGLGGQKYKVVFLFADKKTMDDFVEKGWEAGASANAVAGEDGKNTEAAFNNGVAVFQMTEGGLMLQADISGTKYWKHKKLNKD